ncbi:hypothetical protein HYR65_03800, partial [Candidatus Azambacteria bacterium]|nr:hypothetical protein [Candidatus Azambacteria bacterium]
MEIFNGAALSLIFTLISIGLFVGAVLGYLLRKKIAKIQVGTLESKLSKLVEHSKTEAKGIV